MAPKHCVQYQAGLINGGSTRLIGQTAAPKPLLMVVIFLLLLFLWRCYRIQR